MFSPSEVRRRVGKFFLRFPFSIGGTDPFALDVGLENFVILPCDSLLLILLASLVGPHERHSSLLLIEILAYSGHR